ncbi:MAG: type II toxin-antitoxin system VapC family toxin [Actinobacteria bacterium]|nr:type II toxin-antitoxin system VapC family toxin [Actinomycetota bacterium]
MILDTSAILAVLFDEPDRDDFLDKIAAAEQIGIGAPTVVETAIVLTGTRGDRARGQLDGFLERADAVVISFEDVHWRRALDAWARFGRGRHAAALNFGDCLSYAVAAVADEPLLCKGDDFARTDLQLA